MGLARILVATDFSTHSAAAARLAVAVARSQGAALRLFHVDQAPESTAHDASALLGVRPELWRQYRESSAQKAHEQLADQVAALRPWSGQVEIDAIVDYGHIGSAIERRARAWSAELIVIGSHGAGADERYLFGSVLSQLLPTAPCPLLVTRASQVDRLPDEHGFARPLVAIDYSPFAEPLARLAARLAAPGATIDLVHVWRPPVVFEQDPPWGLSPADRRALDDAADLAIGRERARLDEFRRRVLGDGAARCLVGNGRVASVLLDHARQSGCDLVVVGARGVRPGDGIGSVTDRVLRHAPVPILFVPDGLPLERTIAPPRRPPRPLPARQPRR